MTQLDQGVEEMTVINPEDVYIHCCKRCGCSFEDELQKAREKERGAAVLSAVTTKE